MLGADSWSVDGRFLAMHALDASRRATLLIVAGSLRRVVGSFTFGTNASWSPTGARVALATDHSVRVCDPVARRVVATIPVHAPYGLGVDSLRWSADGRSLELVGEPGLGHD